MEPSNAITIHGQSSETESVDKVQSNSVITNAASSQVGETARPFSNKATYAADVRAQIIKSQARKPRKTICSEKHNEHNRLQKEAAANRNKAWQDANKDKTKYCYVCKKTKSKAEFNRVRGRSGPSDRGGASGRCVACTNSPAYPAAYRELCKERGWMEPQPHERGFMHSTVFEKVNENVP